MNMKRGVLLCSVMSFLLVPIAWAQETLYRGVAEYVPIEGAEAIEHGLIIGLAEGVYRVVDEAYSDQVVGVVSLTPSVAVSSVGTAGTVPIVTSGTTEVRVTGDIQAGDYVTASATPGVGRRADQAGFTLGRALSAASGDEVSLIPVAIDVRFTWPPGAGVQLGTLLASPGETLATLPRPLRYVAALIVVAIAIMAGYWIYHRMSASTVTAMGRNPLARRSIIVLAGVQSFGTLLLVVAGFVLAYLILVV